MPANITRTYKRTRYDVRTGMGREALEHNHDQTALAQLAAGWALLARDLSGSLAALGLPGEEDFYLRGDGSWTKVAGGLEWEYYDGDCQVEDKAGVLADTSAGQWTLTLPDDPEVGMEVGIVDVARAFATNSLMVDAGGHLIEGEDEVLECDVHASAFTLVYASAEQGWVINQMASAAPVDAAASTPSLRTLGAGALQATAGNDSRLTDKRDPNDHDHAGTGSGGTIAHSVTTSRDAADSHPETAISSDIPELAVVAAAATLTVTAGIHTYRRLVNCAGAACELSIAGTLQAPMAGEFWIVNGALISYPAGWKWQTDSGSPPTPPVSGTLQIYWKLGRDAAGTGFDIWAYNMGEVSYA
jgi:hypothetical protein